MDAIKYLKEQKRMCETYQIDCEECPFFESFDGENVKCDEFPFLNPGRAVDLVEKWSAENPQKTILQDYVEKHPNAPLRESGLPKYVCPNLLGYIGMEQGTCPDCLGCWNRPLEG